MKSFKNTFRFSSAAALVLVLQSLLLAEAPQEIHYQGKLTGTDGTPVSNGSYALTFRICGDNPGSGSCLSLWETTLPTVSVNAGVFSVTLTGLPASVFQGGVDRWLELTYGGSTFMPRQKLVAAPYALAVATDSVGNDELKSNSVNSAKIANNSIKNEDLSPTAGIQATKIDFSPGVAVGTLLSGDEKLAVSGDVRLEGLLTVGVGGTAIKKFISAEGTLSNPFMVPPNSTRDRTLTLTGARTGDALLLGLPKELDSDLIVIGLILADDVVTFRFFNTTGSPISSCDTCLFRASIIQSN